MYYSKEVTSGRPISDRMTSQTFELFEHLLHQAGRQLERQGNEVSDYSLYSQ